MNQIIDKPLDLIKKSDNELEDAINDSKYNSPNLRELVRRCLKSLKEYIEYSDYLKDENEKLRKIILSGDTWNPEVAKMLRKLQNI